MLVSGDCSTCTVLHSDIHLFPLRVIQMCPGLAGWVVRLRIWICTLTVRFATDLLVSTSRPLHCSQLIVDMRVLKHPFSISIRRYNAHT